LQTIQKEVTNCVFEEVTLEQSHGTEAVFCAEGKISESHKTGYAVRHQTTYVWTVKLDKEAVSCKTELVHTGPAQISNEDLTNGKQRLRIHDSILQVDFFLANTVKMCNGNQGFTVEGESHTFVTYENKTNTITNDMNHSKFKFKSPITLPWHHVGKNTSQEIPFLTVSNLDLINVQQDAADYISAHFNYYQVRTVHQLNRLNTEISQLDCQLDKMHVSHIFTLSKTSPVLAA